MGNCENIRNPCKAGASSPFLQRATTVILWAGLLTARLKVTVSGIPNCLNYCIYIYIYVIYKCGRWPCNNLAGRGLGSHVLKPEEEVRET